MVGEVTERRLEVPSVPVPGRAGRGKLLFFGEQAAVYGYPAVGITLPMGVRVSLVANPETAGYRLRGVRPEHRAKFGELLDAARSILRSPRAFEGVDIVVESNLPIGRGLGSSASLCVALLTAGAVSLCPESEASPETLWSYAHQAERLFHGRPSGIDTGLASGSGVTALYPRHEGLPERRRLSSPPFWLVVGTVPRSRTAIDLIGAVARGYAEGRKSTVDAVGELGRISERAIDAFSFSEDTVALIGALSPLAEAAQERLASLGLSTPELESALAAGRAAGGTVGKLSGAGGGGAYYFLAEDGGSAERIHGAVAEDLRRRGAATDGLFRPFFWTGETLATEMPTADTSPAFPSPCPSR